MTSELRKQVRAERFAYSALCDLNRLVEWGELARVENIIREVFEKLPRPAHEQSIKNSALWLATNGHASLAIDLLEEAAISLRINVLLDRPKSSAQAKRDGDWEKVKEKVSELTDLMRGLPLSWRDPITDEFTRQMENGNVEH